MEGAPDSSTQEAIHDGDGATAPRHTSPSAYYQWLQSICSALHDADAGEQETKRNLEALRNALETKHASLLLTEQESILNNVLAIYGATQEQGALLVDANILQQAVATHRSHTFDASASALDMRAFTAYVSLLTQLHYAYLQISPADDDLTTTSLRADEEDDLIVRWTKHNIGPKVYTDGRYSSLGSLAIPTRNQAKAAGVDAQWDALLSTAAVRDALRDAYLRAAGHLTDSQRVWALYHQFELTHLSPSPSSDEVSALHVMYLSRLRTPHTQIDATAQSFSSFVSRHLPPTDYESTMTDAYKLIVAAKEILSACEPHEQSLAVALASCLPSSSARWGAWKPYTKWAAGSYITHMNRKNHGGFQLDTDSVCSIFERAAKDCGLPPSCPEEMLANGQAPSTDGAIVAARGRESKSARLARQDQEAQALQADINAAADMWKDYIAFLISAKASPTQIRSICARAVRAVPSSGLLHGQVLRVFSRLRLPQTHLDEVFSAALEKPDLASNVDSLVELLLARVDIERESIASGFLLEGQAEDLSGAHALVVQSSDAFMNIFGVVSFALEIMDGKNAKDPQLRLERLLSDWCLHGPEGTQSLAEARWEAALQQQVNNSLVWLSAARYHSATSSFKRARNLYKSAINRRDMPSDRKVEAAEELLRLEHVAGSAADVDWAYAKLQSEREKSWSEYYATYAAQQREQRAPIEAPLGADVEMADSADTGEKRKADEAVTAPSQNRQISPLADKRGRQGDTANHRDRENSSVMVDNLQQGASQEDVLNLFKDCGDIREIIGPKSLRARNGDESSTNATALVEFVSRDAVSAARSRNGKFIDGLPLDVQRGWECTLYVTNFPPSMDSDEAIRTMFQPYGRIFDVRWPSKKFASSRRFCYVVFCNAREAQAALQLHNSGMEAGGNSHGRLQVLVSDPNHKKVRSDAYNDDKELFVSGIPRGAEEVDVRAVLEPGVLQVRFLRHPDGRPRGLAYVDMATTLDAQRALGQAGEQEGGGFRVKGKLINVKQVDKQQNKSQAGVSGGAEGSLRQDFERRSRSLQVHGLPYDAQEAIIQQAVERHYGANSVQRVQWTPGEASHGTAVIEFHDASTAGKVALDGTLVYDADHPLEVRPLDSRGAAARLHPSALGRGEDASANDPNTPAAFAPRQAMASRRGRGGLGIAARRPHPSAGASNSQPDTAQRRTMDIDPALPAEQTGSTPTAKKQDAFRAMLGGGGA